MGRWGDGIRRTEDERRRTNANPIADRRVQHPMPYHPLAPSPPRRITPSPARAYATGGLVVIQALVWLVVVFSYRNGEWLDFALLPRRLDLYRLAVAPFVHVHPYHLGFNLVVLWLFGSSLERSVVTG